MHQPLLIKNILVHARRTFPATEIISALAKNLQRPIPSRKLGTRSATVSRTHRTKNKTGDRVATLAWNDHRHLELYYAVSGIGAVCHTINPRLPQKQLGYIIEHANDALIFVDEGLVGLLEMQFCAQSRTGQKSSFLLTQALHCPFRALALNC